MRYLIHHCYHHRYHYCHHYCHHNCVITIIFMVIFLPSFSSSTPLSPHPLSSPFLLLFFHPSLSISSLSSSFSPFSSLDVFPLFLLTSCHLSSLLPFLHPFPLKCMQVYMQTQTYRNGENISCKENISLIWELTTQTTCEEWFSWDSVSSAGLWVLAFFHSSFLLPGDNNVNTYNHVCYVSTISVRWNLCMIQIHLFSQ